ncbi:MAG TPA: hypothetical protein VGP94_09435 [Tepidisphaeraceae bacterium]|nr:hypothetical protein [Tepidisphaeraceae bacterium]
MPRAAINDILRRIDALSDEDRIQLDLELAKRLEREWEKESKKARKIARAKGITQEVIDKIIHRRRYGP